MAPSDLGGIIIKGHGPTASARAEGEEGDVASVSAAARPLCRCQAKIGGPGQPSWFRLGEKEIRKERRRRPLDVIISLPSHM